MALINKLLVPGASLLAKLGSIAVHVDEFTSRGGHEFDAIAMRGLLDDPEVKEWLAGMDKLAMIPKKRG